MNVNLSSNEFFPAFQKLYKDKDFKSLSELIIEHLQANYLNRLNGKVLDDVKDTMFRHFEELGQQNISFLHLDTVYDEIFLLL